MHDLTTRINENTELAAVDIDAELVTQGAAPVLATPAAFMAGIGIGSAIVAAFAAGDAAG